MKKYIYTAILAMCAVAAQAATNYWDGEISNDLGAATNWVGDVAPNSTDDFVVTNNAGFTGTGNWLMSLGTGLTPFGSLEFSAAGTGAEAGRLGIRAEAGWGAFQMAGDMVFTGSSITNDITLQDSVSQSLSYRALGSHGIYNNTSAILKFGEGNAFSFYAWQNNNRTLTMGGSGDIEIGANTTFGSATSGNNRRLNRLWTAADFGGTLTIRDGVTVNLGTDLRAQGGILKIEGSNTVENSVSLSLANEGSGAEIDISGWVDTVNSLNAFGSVGGGTLRADGSTDASFVDLRVLTGGIDIQDWSEGSSSIVFTDLGGTFYGGTVAEGEAFAGLTINGGYAYMTSNGANWAVTSVGTPPPPLAVSWDGGAGNNNWNNPTNWTDNFLPTNTTDVTIDDMTSLAAWGGINIAAGNQDFKSLTIDQARTAFRATGDLAYMNAYGDITFTSNYNDPTGTAFVNGNNANRFRLRVGVGSASIYNYGQSRVKFDNGGTRQFGITSVSGTSDMMFNGTGDFEYGAYIYNAIGRTGLADEYTGTMDIVSGANINPSIDFRVQGGTVTVSADGVFNDGMKLTLNDVDGNGALIDFSGRTENMGNLGSFNNAGTLVVDASTALTFADYQNSGGTIAVSNWVEGSSSIMFDGLTATPGVGDAISGMTLDGATAYWTTNGANWAVTDDSGAPPAVSAMVVGPDDVSFTVSGYGDAVVWVTDDLVGGTWVPVETNTVEFTFTDVNAVNLYPIRFYKVERP